jgi:hypothetical protein
MRYLRIIQILLDIKLRLNLIVPNISILNYLWRNLAETCLNSS